ncbi:hypothetical protein BS47DRAFT_1398242 [Hydnum rufescens UP504]|uniref:D-xylose 1-dehydrogenase (NADP(+), D-xylono-1,5-lactone-forming) n=1 Tax=Hydnum rufescens UP504 TaxID=1448309 RepID=A0A9P6AL92_9AGAM|nr:hypothetical protein BS47DRAFT_1398242 [Hydnum rufescens UP504]
MSFSSIFGTSSYSEGLQLTYPLHSPKEPNALRIGILGAAKVAPYAMIDAARSHPGVIIEAGPDGFCGIAARDQERAKAFAAKHGIPRVFASYQELVDDPNIDAVYIPLSIIILSNVALYTDLLRPPCPGLHYEWTMKSLRAGKHVLVEKPVANTAEEAASMFALAKEKNLVLLEGLHYRFHPANQTIRALLESGTIGKITGADAELALPALTVLEKSFLSNYDAGGGAVMALGCYPIHLLRYVLGADPVDILKIAVNPFAHDPRADRSMRAVFELPNDVTASIYCDLNMPKRSILGPTPFFRYLPRFPSMTIKIFGEEGEIYMNNFLCPSNYHTIYVTKNDKTESIKAYTGEQLSKEMKGDATWSTFRYQLEAFVDKVRGRTPQTWITPEDSITNMQVIDDLYENSGLGKRPTSDLLGKL